MDEDDDYATEPLRAVQLQGIDVAILVLDSIGALARIPARFFTELTELVCQHANYRVAKERMANQARVEIEMLVRGNTE